MDKSTRFDCQLNRCIAALAALVTVTTAAGLEADPTEEKEKELSLEVAVVLAESDPTLAFSATNIDQVDLTVDEVGIGYSPIVITKPTGEEVKSVAYIQRNGPPPTIKPTQVRMEKENLFNIFNREGLNTPGLYRVRWQTKPHGSKSIYRSNDILILREKGTPVIDPVTGRPVPQSK